MTHTDIAWPVYQCLPFLSLSQQVRLATLTQENAVLKSELDLLRLRCKGLSEENRALRQASVTIVSTLLRYLSQSHRPYHMQSFLKHHLLLLLYSCLCNVSAEKQSMCTLFRLFAACVWPPLCGCYAVSLPSIYCCTQSVC